MKKLISIAVLGLTSLGLGGCAMEHGENAAAGETENAFSANWNYSWGDTKQSHADIGTSVGRTCFMTGVGGDFRPGGTIWDPPGSWNPAWGGVRVNAQTNHYEIYVAPSAGHSMIVQARCVNSAANRVTKQWSGGADVVLGPVTAHRQCFLTQIGNAAVNETSTSYWGFTNTSDYVHVYHDNVSWYVGGSFQKAWSVVEATCVDAPEHIGDYNGALAANPGSTTKNLTNVSGATCGLTKVQGLLEAKFGDWADEVSINVPNGGTQFTLVAKNGKAGSATCMK